jgi:hypothetical protein
MYSPSVVLPRVCTSAQDTEDNGGVVGALVDVVDAVGAGVIDPLPPNISFGPATVVWIRNSSSVGAAVGVAVVL